MPERPLRRGRHQFTEPRDSATPGQHAFALALKGSSTRTGRGIRGSERPRAKTAPAAAFRRRRPPIVHAKENLIETEAHPGS